MWTTVLIKYLCPKKISQYCIATSIVAVSSYSGLNGCIHNTIVCQGPRRHAIAESIRLKVILHLMKLRVLLYSWSCFSEMRPASLLKATPMQAVLLKCTILEFLLTFFPFNSPTQQSDWLSFIFLQDWFDKFEFLQFEVRIHYLCLVHYARMSDWGSWARQMDLARAFQLIPESMRIYLISRSRTWVK